MKTVTQIEAASSLKRLLAETAHSHEPIHISDEQNDGVLLSEKDWRSIEETLYLLSVPGMRESLLEGRATPPFDCSTALPW